MVAHGQGWRGALGLMLLGCTGVALAGQADASESLRQAIAFMQQGNWTRAGQAVDQALAMSPEDLQALYWKSYLLFQAAKYEQSSTYASRYLTRNPANGAAHKILGLDYFMQAQRALAETELQQACELSPADSEARYYLGRVHFERQNLPAALESFRRVIVIDPGSVRGYNHLGQTLEGLARFEEARSAYKKSIELDQGPGKKSEWACFNLGVLALKEGQAQEAIQWLKEALLRRPSWPEATVQLAAALGSVAHFEESRQLLEELLTVEPKNADAHYQLARLLLKMRRPEEARRHFQLFQELKKL